MLITKMNVNWKKDTDLYIFSEWIDILPCKFQCLTWLLIDMIKYISDAAALIPFHCLRII